MADASYHFLSFVRSGFAAAVTRPDTLGAVQPAVATSQVSVTISGASAPITRTVAVRGPGDVTGVSATQVVRTDPISGAVGVEPNYFAQIEFDRPDLPWMFTPAANAGEKLRPWLVLVVLEASGEHACRVLPGTPLPHVRVAAVSADQLPDLRDSHLWAHAQVVTPDGVSVVDAVHGDPRLSVSRLLCPRHLQPNTSYLAVVAPAFAAGRITGLGQSLTEADEATLEPAWQPGQAVDLPVYYSWEFRTGEDADFESLARKLTGTPLPPGIGTRPLDMSRPGAGIPAIDPPADVHDSRAIERLDGALRPVDSDAVPGRDPAADAIWRSTLTVLLDRPAQLLKTGDQDPVVSPPVYGDHHALVFTLDGASPPPWLTDLNLSARARVAAGIGTEAVRGHQEDYVARSWRQLGDVMDANRLLRTAQLARTTGLRVFQRLSSLDAAATIAVTSPLHDRVVGAAGAGVTVTRAVAASRLPGVAVRPAFRRLARAGGAISRTAARDTLATDAVRRFAGEAFHADVAGPDGATAMRPASDVIGGVAGSALLVALGGPPSGATADQVIATLNADQTALPLDSELSALPRRADVGAAAVIASLGAVSASTLSEVIQAAANEVVPGAPVPPPALPDGRTRGRGGVLPHGLAGPVRTRPSGLPGQPARRAFVPAGPRRHLGGVAVLVGGTVTVDTDLVRTVGAGTREVAAVDDAHWAALLGGAGVPAITPDSDPATDPGARLAVIRGDPDALAALARVAAGDVRASVDLDRLVGTRATAGAALAGLLGGTVTPVLPPAATAALNPADADATAELLVGAAAALGAMVALADSPEPPDGAALDLPAARAGLLERVDPNVTVSAGARSRITSLIRPGVEPRDDLDPVMACPAFQDPMWLAVRDLGNDWLLPGLELVPPDTATLVRTNPSFVAAFLVGTNHEMMRELLWREYPTDQRGTAFTRFWGRTGAHRDDIGPIHLFHDHLPDNLLTGQDSEAVLLLRSELLRRYPGSVIYLSRARQVGGNLLLDEDTIELPLFRGDLGVDVSFVGFPITPDELRAAGDPWYVVIAQPPTEPRFGLDESSAHTPAVPTQASELSWTHMAPGGDPAARAPFAPGDPPTLHGQPLDGSLHWGDSAAVQAHLTYQNPVRVAIRAADLLPPTTPPPPPGPGQP